MTKHLQSLIVAGLVCASTLSPAADKRPNVLFLAVDDMNDWMSGNDAKSQHTEP